MSNARDTETSPLTPEQQQRAEALRIAASILSDRGPFTAGSLPGGRTPDDAIALADYILTGLLHVPGPPIEAEIEDDAPEPEPGDASATEKVTECQWPGCDRVTHRLATFKVDQHAAVHAYDACDLHRGRRLVERMP